MRRGFAFHGNLLVYHGHVKAAYLLESAEVAGAHGLTGGEGRALEFAGNDARHVVRQHLAHRLLGGNHPYARSRRTGFLRCVGACRRVVAFALTGAADGTIL